MTQRKIIVLLCCLFALTLPLEARKTALKGTPAARLLALTREQGSIRVLVGVRDEAWQPEGKLLPQDVALQRGRAKTKIAALLEANPKVMKVPGWEFETIPAFVAVVNEEALRALLDDDAVSTVEEDLAGEFVLSQSVVLIGAKAVHDRQHPQVPYKGNDQIVVVIDNGVDAGHPFLGGRVLTSAAACFSGEKISGAGDPIGTYTTVCPNGLTTQIGAAAGAPCQSGVAKTDPHPCNHGTRVAGVIAGDDGSGMTGVAPAAKIIPIQVASLQNGSVKGLKSSVIKALDYVAGTLAAAYPGQIAAVNISLGFPQNIAQQTPWAPLPCDSSNTLMLDAVAGVLAENIAVVAATGNAPAGQTGSSTGVMLPACLSNVIAVSASTDGDQVASYAHVAEEMELFAPGGVSGTGQGIYTSQNRDCSGCLDDYYEDHGTSMAAPHVAGAFAVLREKSPSASVATLLGHLTSSPVTIRDNRNGPSVTKPRIKLDHAIDQGQPPSPPTAFAANATSTTAIRLTWTEPNPVPSGATYVIRVRTEHGGSLALVAEVPAPATLYDHTGRPSGTMFQYEITTKVGGVESSVVSDYAVTRTFTDDPIQAGSTLIRGIHIGELREAADAWREFAPGLTDAFTSALYAGPTGLIYAADLNGVVSALNGARTAMGLPAFAYVDVATPAAGVVVDRRHVEQLRTSMR